MSAVALRQDSVAAGGADAGAVTVPPPAAPPRVGPPDSSGDMALGYAAAAVIFLAYIGLLLKRVASVRRSR